MNHTPSLADIFTPDQQSQLAQMIAEIMAGGWGSIEVTIVDGKPKFFSSKRSYRAVPVADQSDITGNAPGIPLEVKPSR